MFKRYELTVSNFNSTSLIYSASFSSINHLVKFASGFNFNEVVVEAVDVVFEKSIPIEELCNEFCDSCLGF